MKRPGRSNVSKTLIAEALLELLKTVNYEQICVSDICTLATVSRNTFYRHFDSKDAVLLYHLAEKCRYIIRQFELLETYDPLVPTNEDLRRSYTRFYTYWLNQRPLLELLARHHLLEYLLPALMQVITNSYSEQWVESLRGPFSSFPSYYYNWLASSLYSILISWIQNGFDLPPEAIAELLVRISSSITEKKAYSMRIPAQAYNSQPET